MSIYFLYTLMVLELIVGFMVIIVILDFPPWTQKQKLSPDDHFYPESTFLIEWVVSPRLTTGAARKPL